MKKPACAECGKTDVEVGRYPGGRWLCFDCDIKLQDRQREQRTAAGRRVSYSVDDPIILEALTVWHEAGRAEFKRRYPSLDYDSPDYAKTAKERRKYIALDRGTGGAFLVDKATGDVWTIKGYGVAGRRVMHISDWAAYWTAATDDNPYRLIYVRRGRA